MITTTTTRKLLLSPVSQEKNQQMIVVDTTKKRLLAWGKDCGKGNCCARANLGFQCSKCCDGTTSRPYVKKPNGKEKFSSAEKIKE
ncbi:unnamed protein product [Linum tenue]|uniref:Uncharacterized protein n=1 Tax=Linum tenue TaxID=586396 RepID=A0AAV0P3C6_9ROSI|nr:unnamed protein product [Linum tenue]